MPTTNLWAGVLSQLLMHQESGCPHAARHAIRMLDQLCECADLDDDLRLLCERAALRLDGPLSLPAHRLPTTGVCHAGSA